MKKINAMYLSNADIPAPRPAFSENGQLPDRAVRREVTSPLLRPHPAADPLRPGHPGVNPNRRNPLKKASVVRQVINTDRKIRILYILPGFPACHA
jgi:hypothetical protein